MNRIIFTIGLLSVEIVSAQDYSGRVGVNTITPSATLDILPNPENSKETANTAEGLLIPRLSKIRVANINTTQLKEGTLVYVVDETTNGVNRTIAAYKGNNTKVADITEKGFYYWDGTKWTRIKGVSNVGANGATFTPSVDANGNITWTNDKGLPNPNNVNIKGPQGVAGTKGDKGDKGDTGPAGARGLQGVAGAKGDKGDKGDTGPAGARGLQGVAGAKGDKGDKGDTGPQGPSGVVKGIKGITYDANSKEVGLPAGTSNNQVLKWNGTAWAPQEMVIPNEPWRVVGGTDQATSNTQNIYQMGNVGIRTNTPNATLEIAKIAGTSVQGVLLPRLSTAERNSFTNGMSATMHEGLMIYNTTKKCIDWWDGEGWQCMSGTKKEYTPVNPTTDTSVKAQLWDRTHYIGSFNHNGVNVDGKIENTGTNTITLPIAYNEATTGKAYNAINVSRTITDRSGAIKTLTLSIPAGTFSSAKGFLQATVKVSDGSAYQVPQLAAFAEQELTNFVFSINGRASNVRLIASGGVLDKKFNVQTNGKLEHQFIYVPDSGYPDIATVLPNTGEPYEKKWLNNNLGAEYAKISSTYFSPNTQAGGISTDTDTIKKDWKAYGSLFEWNRDSDGHEIINWTSSTAGTFAHSDMHNFNHTNAPQTNAGDPCPSGYHTPTKVELQTYSNSIGNSNVWNDKTLRLPAAGYRNYSISTLSRLGDQGLYWSSTPYDSDYTWFMLLLDTTLLSAYYRTYGFSVRCIAN